MKRRFRWPSRKSGDGGASNIPNVLPEVRNAGASPQRTTAALPERPKPRASADRSSSTPSIPNLSGAGSQLLPSLATDVSHPAFTSTPQNAQHSTSQDGTLLGANTSKKDYWQLAVNQLQEEDSAVADQIAGVQQAATAAGDVDFAAQLLSTTKQGQQELESKRWKIGSGSRGVVLRDRFDQLVKAVTLFKDVGNAAGSIDPLHAGLPLAGFCVLMQIATSDSEQYAAMVAGVEEIITIVARYSQIEALYLSRPKTALKQDFERHLLSLYKHIIRYQISATCYYRRSTMVRFIRAFPKLDDVSEVLATIRRDDTACRNIGQVFDSSDALERHQELLDKLNRFEKYLMKQKDPGLLPLTENMHWTVARSANTLFTGRDKLLCELGAIARDTVQNPSPQDQCRVVITGMGGQGKSEICLQLAHRVRQSFWGVFWVDVSTEYLAESAFLDIASRLQAPVQTWEDGRQGLANVQHPWLLVLDNADDPRVDYQRYLPTGPSGMVMLTSRNEQCKRYATQKHIRLDGLLDAEARELVLSAADVPNNQRQTLQDDAQAVTALLRSHPLALILAGSYVSRGHCTLAKYPDVYEKQRRRLLTFELTQAQSRYRDVYATFEASANILQSSPTESAGDALQLLPVLATSAPSRLPLALFEAGWKGAQSIPPSNTDDAGTIQLTPWHVSHLLPLMQVDTDTWDSFRLIEAISLLKAFSLVSTDIHDGFLSVSMHPLTHAWARDRQEMAEQHESWVTTGCLVALSRSRRDFWRQHGRQLQPHVQALTGWVASEIFASWPLMKITGILVNCGWLLYDMRDDAKLFVLMNDLLTHLSLDRQIVDEQWSEVYELTAWNLINYGKIKEAVTLLDQVVKIQEQTLAEDHPARLASQHALAMAYEANGQVREAVTLLQQVVKIKEQTLAEDHPDRLASQHALAMAYEANGQVREAVTLLQQVVKIQEQTLAEDHPARLASQHALAIAYQANGQVREAVTLLQQVVKIKEQTLAEDHPDRLASQHALAIAYEANGQVREAVTLLEQVVKIEEQTLAEDHPARLASQQVLASMYWDLGRRNIALQMMKNVVEIHRRVLDKHHPARTGSERWLDYFEREMGNSQPTLYDGSNEHL